MIATDQLAMGAVVRLKGRLGCLLDPDGSAFSEHITSDELIAALRESGREAEAAVVKARAANAYRNLRGETVADGDAWTP